MPDSPSCFVVMGFNEKTDPISGKTFDLDKSYRILIKPAAEAAGLKCIRADEIVHARVIDVPMYEQLLGADLVIADLSTLNPNAFFELGVRYALRPHATVVIAESGFKNPFDTNHISTLSYTHLGKGIDAEDAESFRAKLTGLCKEVMQRKKVDSPVYTFIRELEPPKSGAGIQLSDSALKGRAVSEDDPLSKPLAELMDLAMNFRKESKFQEMRATLEGIVQMMGDHPKAFAVQQLALATYKSKQPNELQALEDAQTILSNLDPEGTNDPETLGLWGAIHKRLADIPERADRQRKEDLDTAIFAHEKGYYLKDDYYNGINFAYLLNVRAARSDGDERIADRIQARRVRERLATRLEKQISQRETKESTPDLKEEAYWMRATMAEAHAGLGNVADAQKWLDEAERFVLEDWMLPSTQEQLEKLQSLIAEAEH